MRETNNARISIIKLDFLRFENFILVLLILANKDAMFDARHLLEPQTGVLIA